MTDKGTKLFNSSFKMMLKKHRFYHYTYNNQEIKASMVERWQRTIKSKGFRCFTHSNSYRYINELQNVLLSYNNSIHFAHHRSPNSINYHNQEEVWQALYN